MESRNKLTMCRLCLRENESFINVFEHNDMHSYIAAELITDLLQFQVSKTDAYPHVVCSKCLTKLTEFKLFKECCQKSKDTYDNMFVSHEIPEEQTPEMVTIKTEEVTIDSSSYEVSEDPLMETEVRCGPILLKYEVLPFSRDSHPQEELIHSEVSGNEGIVESTGALMHNSPQPVINQEELVNDCSSGDETDEPFKGFDSEVEVPLAETFVHPKYPHSLEEKTPHISSKEEIVADSCTWSLNSKDELIFKKTKNISLSEEVEASSSGTTERLEFQRILPGESMDMAPLTQQEKERVRIEQETGGDGETWRVTGQKREARESREGCKCYHCGIELMSKLGLLRHMKVHGFVDSYEYSKSCKCDECSKCFSNSSNLKSHMRLHTGSKPYKCEECSKSFTQSSTLITHMRIHTGSKPYKCAECSKHFSQNGSLKIHMRFHTGSKPYKCDECSKCFSNSSNLKSHMRLHTGSKPYKCEECSKCFINTSNLKSHMRLHTGSKPYKCEECSKHFRHNCSLKRHMRLHTGSKPYKCAKCSKCFSRSSSLKNHMRLHTGSKPYKCAECSKSFTQNSTLITHMRLHTGSKPYKCAECSKCFRQTSNLNAHMRLHTGSKTTNVQNKVNLFVKVPIMNHT